MYGTIYLYLYQGPYLYFRYQSKISTFSTPPVFSAPLGMTPLEFRQDQLHQKTRVPGLLEGYFSVVLTEYQRVTDQQTEMLIHDKNHLHQCHCFESGVRPCLNLGQPWHFSFLGSL